MGKRDRERIARINSGSENPISVMLRYGAPTVEAAMKDRLLFCYACHTNVLQSKVYEHIRGCWEITIADGAQVSPMPPVEILIKRHKEFNLKLRSST